MCFTSTNLRSLVFPSALTWIGLSAFQDCQNLRMVDLSAVEQFHYVGKDAFSDCERLNDKRFGEHVEYKRFF